MKRLIAVGLMVMMAALARAVEYKVVRLGFMSVTETKQTEMLNKMAAEGWRLVDVSRGSEGTTIDFYLIRDEEKAQ